MYKLVEKQIPYYTRDGIVMLTKPLLMREDTNDYNTLLSILQQDEYLVRVLPEPAIGDTYVDIGAHIGGYTAYIEAIYPRCNTIAVEAVRENVEILLKNIYGRCYHLAAAEKSGKKLHLSYGDVPNGVHRFIANNSGTVNDTMGFDVETISLNNILSKTIHVKVLKMDCEGGEYNILKGASKETLDKIDYIIGEHHYFSPEFQGRRDLFNLVKGQFKDISKKYMKAIAEIPLGEFLFQNKRVKEKF